MKRLFFTENDFLCEVIPNERLTIDDMIVGRNIPKNVPFEKVEHDSLPSTVLRGAWKLNGSSVDVDIPKGKEIAHGVRRSKREEFMADNSDLIQRDSIGIPLKPGQSATAAKLANKNYKQDVDDVMQVAIDAATDEAELLTALGIGE